MTDTVEELFVMLTPFLFARFVTGTRNKPNKAFSILSF